MREKKPADDTAQDSIAMDDPLIDAARTTWDATHLKCANCGYLLVGLPEDRCPECGLAFDRARLLMEASSEGRRVHPWNDSSGWVRPFLSTCYLTWFHPSRFASSFPRFHSVRSAWAFSSTCYATALIAMWAVTVAPLLLIGRETVIVITTFVAALFAAFVVAGVACESLSALMLSRCVRVPHVSQPEAYHFWRGITHFFGSYLIVSSAGGAMVGGGPFSLLGWPVVAGTYLWWMVALGQAVSARTPDQPGRRFAALILLLVIGIVALGFAAILGLVAFTVWYDSL